MSDELIKEILEYINNWCVEENQEWGDGSIYSIEDERQQFPDSKHVELYDKVKNCLSHD